MKVKDCKNIQVLFRIIKESPKVYRILIPIFALLCLSAFNGGLIGVFTKEAIDAISKNDRVLFNETLEKGLFIIFYVSLTWSIYEWLHELMDYVVLKSIRNKFQEKLCKIPYETFKKNSGDILSVFNNDLPRAPEVIGTMLWFVMNPIWFIVSLVILAKYNLYAAIPTLITAIIVAFISWIIFPKVVKSQEEVNKLQSDMTVLVKESADSPEMIKAYIMNELVNGKMKKLSDEKERLGVRGALIQKVTKEGISASGKISLVISMIIIGFQCVNGHSRFSDLGLAVVLITNAISVMAIPPMNFIWFCSCATSAKRVLAVLDIDDTEMQNEFVDCKVGTRKDNSIVSLEDVEFKYEDGAFIGPITLSIDKGSMYAIVGESGSGKSTLINLISGISQPAKGKIVIARDLECKNRSDLISDYIGVVSQNFKMFTGSVRDNILLGRSNISEEKYIQAIKKSGVAEFVDKLPNKDYTLLGKNGTKLSVGQQQRIALARILVKDTPILILDEATSALDNINEDIISNTIINMKEEKTIIAITHREGIMNLADYKVVIDEGKVKSIQEFAS